VARRPYEIATIGELRPGERPIGDALELRELVTTPVLVGAGVGVVVGLVLGALLFSGRR
jgi:hypothetical protein